jgi:cytochrome P450
VASAFPVGAAVRLAQLEEDPHALLALLREREPVSWIPALDGWLVTRYDLALASMRDPGTYTVDDARFTTAQVVGRSMLSLDGDSHARHRAPFAVPFRPGAVSMRFSTPVAFQADALIDRLREHRDAELRRSFAGPLAATIVAYALGLDEGEVDSLLAWYDAIVAGVTMLTAGRPLPPDAPQAFAALSERLRAVTGGSDRSSLLAAAAGGGMLTHEEAISNAAVLLFGGIETTEGMICNTVLALLSSPEAMARVRRPPAPGAELDEPLLARAIEESLRLEPAAAVVDRYATRDAELGGAHITAGDLVRLSIAAANRDPAVFSNPNRFDLDREHHRRHLAFAHGPHVCLGVHLARLEARVGIARLLAAFPDMRLDPQRPAAVCGLVFRKPAALYVFL